MTILLVTGALLAAFVLWFLFEKSRRKTHPVKGGLQAHITLPHTAAFELYGNAFSHCSRKTRLVMAELGIPYTHKPIDLIETGSYETLSPAYLKINPSGLIPTLVHNGHPVYDSDDILTYAAAHAGPGAAKLAPDEPAARARTQTWIDFCNLSSADPTGDMEHGDYKMAHYAFATGIMNLGVMLPSMISGYLSDMLGYKNFFIWVMVATIPAFLATWFVPLKDMPAEETPAEQSHQ